MFGVVVTLIGLTAMSVANAAVQKPQLTVISSWPGVVTATGINFPPGKTASVVAKTATGSGTGRQPVLPNGSFRVSFSFDASYAGNVDLSAKASDAAATASLDLSKSAIALKLYDQTAPGEGKAIGDLRNGQVVDVSSVISPNIWAVPGRQVASVQFCLDSEPCRVETNKPFAMHDDEAATKWQPAKGRHTLRVAGYSAKDGKGTVIERTNITFFVGTRGGAPSAPSGPVASAQRVSVGSKVVFLGDFETGDLEQWSNNCHAVSDCEPPSIEVVSDETRNSKYAGHFVVRDGDTPIDEGERAEVRPESSGSLVHEGDERWYQVSYKFADDFKLDGDWLIVTQWHATNDLSPPVAIEVRNGDELTITSDGADNVNHKIGKVPIGKWSDYVFHIKFSEDKGKGFVEAWQDGVKVVPKSSMRTMATEEAYLKAGIYRDKDATGTSEVWIDNFRVTAP